MNGWSLWQYRDVVNSFLDQCDQGMQNVLLRRLGKLLETGVECKMPVSEPIGDGLFALHGSSGRRWARLIYYFGENRQIIFVHAFFKKTNKIKRQDINISKRIRDSIKERKEISSEINLAS